MASSIKSDSDNFAKSAAKSCSLNPEHKPQTILKTACLWDDEKARFVTNAVKHPATRSHQSTSFSGFKSRRRLSSHCSLVIGHTSARTERNVSTRKANPGGSSLRRIGQIGRAHV